MKALWASALVMGALWAGVNAASADMMCNSDQHNAAVNQNCDLDASAAWTYAPSLSGSPNSPGRTPSDDIVTYSLSGAYFDNFTNGSYHETLSGTWTIDYTTMTMLALSLTATGTETIDLSCQNICIVPEGNNVFQLNAKNQANNPALYLVFSTSPLSVLPYYDGCCSTNLYNLEGGFSPLGDPGQLTQVPEPASLSLLGGALVGLFGFTALRRRRNSTARS
jgi:hypothetical protein